MSKFLSGRQSNLNIGITSYTESKTVLQTTGKVGIGTTDAQQHSLFVVGSTKITDEVIVGAALSVNQTAYIVGVSTFKDRVIFDSTNSIQIPVGTTAERDIVGVAITGQIRYNTELSSFEGYGPGGEWGSLGGVKDVDQDTYIIPELSAGSNENTLYFYTGGYLSGTISSTTGADLNVDLNVDGHIETDTLNVSGISTFGSNVDINASVDILNNLTVDGLSDLDELNVAGLSTFGSNVDVNASVDILNNLTVDGLSDLDELNVAGLSTFAGAADFNGDIDVDGHTELDDLNVSGVSTFTGAIDANGNLDVDGQTELDDLNVSGVSTFAGAADFNSDIDVDGHTELDDLNVSGVSTFAGAIDANGNLDVDGQTELDDVNISGILTATTLNVTGGGAGSQANLTNLIVSGISTFAGAIDANGDLDVDGYTELDDLNVSGVSTFQNNVNVGSAITMYATSGIVSATYFYGDGSNLTGLTASQVGAIADIVEDTTPQLGGDLDVNGNDITGTGNVNLAGIITATEFVGDLTGTATTATTLETGRTFEITGDVVASPIIFDGTGNVSLAATIQPNSVGLGTDTTGDYVKSITGTANEVTVSVTSGEGSTPQIGLPDDVTIGQDLTVSRDLDVLRNLNVIGNITVGGTSATLFTSTLQVEDPDIILGIRTDAFGNDISTDNTANHGGIAIASTEGNPLVDLYVAGIETVPTTYKKIMWFKSGSFSGLGTDAWLSNYAIGIGSTQVSNGVRLAAGNVQVTENDISVVRNINASGIITGTLDNTLTLGTAGTGLSGSATYDNSGASTFTVTSNATDANTASTIVARDGSGNFSAGTITANLTGNVIGNLTGVASTATKLETARDFSVSGDVATASAVSFNGTGNVDLAVTLSNSFDANTSGIITSTGGFVGDLTGNVTGNVTGNLTGTATTATNLADGANITTGTISDDRLPATITSDITGNAATATTATNLADGANITTGTISDDRLPDIITSNINVTSGISTVNQVIVGSAVTINSGGINISSGIVTATTFVGALTGTATTATNLADAANITTGTIDDARLPATITSDITGNAATATTATNLADAANITTGTIDDARLPDLITSNINATSGVSTISQVIVGSAVTITSSGINASTGIVTALQFVGTASTASFAATAFTLNGIFEGELSVGSAVTATNIAGGDTGDIPYQSAANTTTFVDASSAGIGQVLLWNGSAPEWAFVSDATGNLGGINIQDEGSIVGTADSIRTVNFVGNNITATASGSGSTVTLSETPTFDSLKVTGISTFQDDVNIGVGGTTAFFDISTGYVGINTTNPLVALDVNGNVNIAGILTATSFSGDGSALTGIFGGYWEQTDVGINTLSNVGIGTTNPTAKLDVNGTLNVSGVSTFTGAIDANGNLDVDGQTELDDLNVSGVSTFTGAIDANGNLDVDGQTELDDLNVSGVSTFQNNVNVGSGITMYATTGIVSATAFYGSGQNLTDLIAGKLDGVTILDEGSTVGTEYQFTDLNFVGDVVTATGIGSTATITITSSGIDAISISTDTTNQSQYVPYVTSFGSTTGLGATNSFVFNPFIGLLEAIAFSGDGSRLSNTNGFSTALSSDPTSPLYRIYKETRALNVTAGVHTVQSDSDHDNLAFTKADTIVISAGATFEVSSGTTFRTNIIDLFPADEDLDVTAQNLNVLGISTFNGDINVGIGTATGVILTSPNGSKFRLYVDDSGNLSTTAV